MKFFFSLFLFISILNAAFAQKMLVSVAGKRSKIFEQRQLDASILIDTIKANHLYGLGPVENLQGEILVWNNNAFVTAIDPDNNPLIMKNVTGLKAIFFVYSDVAKWDTIRVTEKINSLPELQKIIKNKAYQHGRDTLSAFPFLLLGTIAKGKGHIMSNGEKVLDVTPRLLKEASRIHLFNNEQVQMLGFYSVKHQGVFTHYGKFIHIHYQLINKKNQIGHLDDVSFDSSMPIELLLASQENTL